MTRAPKSRQNNVSPYPGENVHFDNRALPTGYPPLSKKHSEAEEDESGTPQNNRVITEKTETGEEDEKLRLEWRKLGKRCDCLLFYIFATTHVLMIIFIFVAMP